MSKMFDILATKQGNVSRLVQQLVAEPGKAVWEPAQPLREPVEPVAASLTETARRRKLHLSSDAPVFPFNPANSRVAEQYRIARTKIIHDPRRPRMIVVSSAAQEDGKTITSINLAGVLALKPELNVILVEADLHRSHIAGMLGIPATPGLSDVLSGEVQLEDALVKVEQCPNLFVLPGGSSHASATELLDSPLWRNLCETLRREFSYVVLDSPPMDVLADFELLQTVADGVVFVIRPDYTNRADCQKALGALEARSLLGVILNASEDWCLYRAGHSNYYGYYGQTKSQ